MSFVTNTAFLQRYDWRWIAKNTTDTGVAASLTDLQNENSAPGGILQTFLDEASEMVMGAAAVGARYSQDDLTIYGGSLLVRIVCDLTMGLVLKRRGRPTEDAESLSQPYAEALEYLELLRRGERIFFNVPDVPEAGLPGTATMEPTPGIDPPTISQQAGRYFGYPPGCNYPGSNQWPWGW